MKIKILDTEKKAPWGCLCIADVNKASDTLTASAFREWVHLAINKDGYVWNGDINLSLQEELNDAGYLIPLDSGSFMFDRTGGSVQEHRPPVQWAEIADTFGSNNPEDYIYVLDKIKLAALDDQIDEVFAYWCELLGKNDFYDMVTDKAVRNPLKYSLQVMLTWYIERYFSFELGDRFDIGSNGKYLTIRSEEVALKLRKSSTEVWVRIDEKNINLWNTWLHKAMIEMPLEMVGKIIRNRMQRENAEYSGENGKSA